jgi:IS30 family transposase
VFSDLNQEEGVLHMDKYKHLSLEERQKIELLHAKALSLRAIGKELGRSASTISRELRFSTSMGVYRPELAHSGAFERRWRGEKLLRHPELRAEVLDKLRQSWSPEQIAGRMTQEKAALRLCSETIYRHIYSPLGQQEELHRLLTRARKKRWQWYGRRRRAAIPHRVSIHERPKHIENRRELGHWEADLMIFCQHQSQNLLTMIERKTRLTLITRNWHKTKAHTAHAMHRTLENVPWFARQSITMDNGMEFAAHHKIREAFNLQTYFCDTHSPWQKGTIENANGRIRRFLPRSTNLKEIPLNQLEEIEWKINNTPRKCLKFLTPLEAWSKYAK